MKNSNKTKKIVFTFGRFTPPTIGHAKLINKVVDYAKETGSENRIYTSKSFDNEKNPIPYSEKVSFLRQLFPQAKIADDPKAHTAFHVAKLLSDEGFRDVTMIVGSDRVEEFKNTIGKYIKDRNDPSFDPKKHYSFDKWNVVSAGERDPDAQGVEGMSGTKMRDAVRRGDMKAFASGVPSKNAKLVKKIFDTVKKNLTEDVSMDIDSGIDHKKLGPMLDSFSKFASEKLGIKASPTIDLSKAEDGSPSFGAYNPQNNSIYIVTKNRHPMDIFRTVAHELVHHKQKEDGKIGKDIAKEGATGSPQENEANAEAGKIMRWFAKSNPDMFKKGYVVEESLMLDEGINDPGTFKAVFLAGGPGSGKDYVMKQVIAGNGLQEINSDLAFEFLMRKAGLDFRMPDSEEAERDVVRARGKKITKQQQSLALTGRRGVIINGTADDPEKIVAIKKELESMGYDTMMVFVDTRDEVSKQRNIARGAIGGREVPEKIRKEKWESSQKAKPVFSRVFGKDNFVAIDNSEDIRTAPKEVKDRVTKQFQDVFKQVRKFSVEQPIKNPKAREWIEAEAQSRGITDFKPIRSTAFGSKKPAPSADLSAAPQPKQQAQQQAQQAQPVPQKSVDVQGDTPPSASEMDQAKRLGLQYFKFGRWGRSINGKNVVTHTSQNGRLVAKTPVAANQNRQVAEENHYSYKSRTDESFEKEFDREDSSKREWGTDSLTNMYKKDTPGQSTKEKKKKKLVRDAVEPPLGYEFGNNGVGPTFGVPRSPGLGFGYSIPMNESVYNWMTSEKTIARFMKRYGDIAEQKLYEAAMSLDESLSNSNSKSNTHKTISNIKENWEALAGRDMGSVPKQGSKEEMPEDWQKVNRRDKTDGLSPKAVKAYRRENPGSKLQTAVTEKNPEGKRAKRRLSFCRRMKGMKSKLTSAETSRDPDSRINKALRRWNCEE